VRAHHGVPRQYELYGTHRAGAISGIAHRTQRHKTLLDEIARGHGRGDNHAPGNKGDVREFADQATARSAVYHGARGANWMELRRVVIVFTICLPCNH
jgi:hypothetical protein